MVKQMFLVVLVLFTFVNVGSSRQCYRCSGDVQTCNTDTHATQSCHTGHDSCISVVMNDASGMNFLFGCGNSVDCKAAKASCTAVVKKNPGTSCNATCCDTDRCVMPYAKDYKPLQCYDCTSMKDCEMAKVKPCSKDQKRCFKITTEVKYENPKVTLKSYSKGCATEEQCNNKNDNVFYQTCGKDETCHMSCCEGDMCNVGSNTVVSALTLLACFVFAVIRL